MLQNQVTLQAKITSESANKLISDAFDENLSDSNSEAKETTVK